MIESSGDFNEAIKQSVREVGVNISYYLNKKTYKISSEDIITISYTASGKKELGCVILKTLKATVYETEHTLGMLESEFLGVTFVCLDCNCDLDMLYITSVKRNNAGNIEVEAVDLITYLSENPPNVTYPLIKDSSLKEYMAFICTLIGCDNQIGSISNPHLNVAFNKDADILSTLREMSIAGNCAIDIKKKIKYGLSLPFFLPSYLNENLEEFAVLTAKPFRFSSVCRSIDSYISYSTESGDKYKDVRVCIYFPNGDTQTSIGSFNTLLPGSTYNYNIGTIGFENACIPQIIKFNKRVDVDSYTIGADSLSIAFNNSYAESLDLEGEVIGVDMSKSSTLSTSTDNNSNIKVINNQYIQGNAEYDIRIYLNDSITVNYFGDPTIEVGDTIKVDNLTVLVTENTLKYTGGLKGTIKGVILCE